jgi:hypothetical protein
MEIRITDTGVTDAAQIIRNVALVAQDSAEHGSLPSEMYADVFGLLADLAEAVTVAAAEEKAGRVA